MTARPAPEVTRAAPGPRQEDRNAAPGPGRRPRTIVEFLVAAALVAIGALVRAPQLGPSSLWLDDAWLALAAKAEGVGELVTVGVTAPGFAAALAAVVAVAGFSSSSAQALPFVLGVAAAPVLYLVARRAGLGRGAALVGAVLLLASPLHVIYSGRVKPFSADAVLAVFVLFAGWRVVERPYDGRRWGWLALVAVGSVVVSAAVATSVAGAYGAGLVATALRRPRRLAPALASSAGFVAFALVWWWAVIRPASTPALRAYWADHSLDLGAGPTRAAGDLAASAGNVLDGFSGLPPAVGAVAVVLAAVVVGARRPLLAVLLLTPLAAGVALAALGAAPLGGGRTDIHLYPALALVVALGLHLALVRLRRPAAVVASLGALVVVAVPLRPAPPYPEEDLRPLVEVVEASARPDDAIAVYSASRWGHALYTSQPVDLRRDPRSANGFNALVADPRVRVLGPHRDVPARYQPEVEALAADHDRIWLLSSHVRGDFAVLGQLLSEHGYAATRTEDRPGASLILWERAAPVRGGACDRGGSSEQGGGVDPSIGGSWHRPAPRDTQTQGGEGMPITRSGVQMADDQELAGSSGNGASGSAKQRGKVAADTAVDQGRQVASTARRQSQAVAGTAQQQAREVTSTVKEQASQLTQELSAQGRTLYQETREQVQQQAETQTQELAQTFRRLSMETQALAEGRPEDAGTAGEYAFQLADKLHELATGLENRGVSGLIEEVQDFARRRPGAFLAGTALVGFAGGRLLRSATSDGGESASVELPPAPAPARRMPAGQRRVARTARNPASLGGE